MRGSIKRLFLFSCLIFFASAMFAQRTVVGKVVDVENNNPLIGVNILIKGTTSGTVTDLDGRYRISAPEDATLIFSYTGFESIEEEIGNRTSIDVIMSAGARLEEVVVTALGISQEKKSLGYAVQQLSGEEVLASREANVVNSLQGKLAGVLINSSSGAPGAGASIIIRGINSLNPGADNQPLFVVDGIPIGNQTIAGNQLPSAGSNAVNSQEQASFTNRAADIDPNDIESINVLKGPAAAALYGLRAANGVIIITTKKGQEGKAQISYSSSYGIDEVLQYPDQQFAYREGFTGRLRTNAAGNPLRFQQYGPRVFEGQTPVFDPLRDFFQNGSRSENNLSIRGGNDRATFSTSMSYLQHEGVIPFSDWSRLSVAIGGDVKVSDKIAVNAKVTYSNSGGNKPHAGDKSIMSSLSYASASFDINDYINPDGTQRDYSNGIIDNPRYLAEFSTLVDDVNRVRGNVGITYKPLPWLSIDYNVGLDNYNDSRVRTVPAGLDLSSQTGGFLINENINFQEVNSILMARAKANVSDRIKANFLLGHNVTDIGISSNNTRGERFALPNFYRMSNTAAVFSSDSETKQRLIGVFGQAQFSFDDYLYLDLTARNDWSSTLPKENRSFFYPSVGLSWVVSDMARLPSFITFAKLRSSWAQVGKDAPAHSIGVFFQGANNFPFGGVNGFTLSSVAGDAGLRPETTTSIEFGADLRFLKNRLGIDFTWFRQNSRDQIIPVPVSNTTGFSRFITNAGEIQNTGIEVLANVGLIRKKDFDWDMSLNWSTVEGEVIAIRDGVDEILLFGGGFGGITNKLVPGGKVGDLYGFVHERDESGNLLIDANGFPFIRTDTQSLVGNALPDWTAGLTNTFRYKNFGLSFLLELRQGGDVYDLGLRNSLRNGTLSQTERRYEQVIFNGVTADGTPNTTPVEIDEVGFYRNSIRYNRAAEIILEDASWFRLRRVSLSYSLPKSVLQNSFVSGATLTLSGNNLLLNTPFRGYDPETNYFGSGSNILGYTGLQSPGVRSYMATINVSF